MPKSDYKIVSITGHKINQKLTEMVCGFWDASGTYPAKIGLNYLRGKIYV